MEKNSMTYTSRVIDDSNTVRYRKMVDEGRKEEIEPLKI